MKHYYEPKRESKPEHESDVPNIVTKHKPKQKLAIARRKMIQKAVAKLISTSPYNASKTVTTSTKQNKQKTNTPAVLEAPTPRPPMPAIKVKQSVYSAAEPLPINISQVTHAQTNLAEVKHSLYNPTLPTFRQMERDDVIGKLSHEHCRHTTTLTARQFTKAAKSASRHAVTKTHHLIPQRLEGNQDKSRLSDTMQQVRSSWKIFLNSNTTHGDLLPAVRNTGDHRFKLTGNPHIGNSDRRLAPAPIPTDLLSRHRP